MLSQKVLEIAEWLWEVLEGTWNITGLWKELEKDVLEWEQYLESLQIEDSAPGPEPALDSCIDYIAVPALEMMLTHIFINPIVSGCNSLWQVQPPVVPAKQQY